MRKRLFHWWMDRAISPGAKHRRLLKRIIKGLDTKRRWYLCDPFRSYAHER